MRFSVHRMGLRSRLAAIALVVACLSACSSFHTRRETISSLEAKERALEDENARHERVIDTLQASSAELLASLEAARSRLNALEEERDALVAELAAASARLTTLETEKSEAIAELEKIRDVSGDSRSKIAALTEELEAAKARQAKLERRVETLRVCCQAPGP